MIVNSEEREVITIWPSELFTNLAFCNFNVPSFLTCTLLSAEARDAAPPMWKVRMVSCVPGSPIDCAATTPIASPWLIMWPRAKSRP